MKFWLENNLKYVVAKNGVLFTYIVLLKHLNPLEIITINWKKTIDLKKVWKISEAQNEKFSIKQLNRRFFN